MASAVSKAGALGLKAGDWVVVRSQQEILATLDPRARMDELPFQPEMLAYCGRRMRVAKVAHKTCDNIMKTGGRRMEHAVHLEGARCDGAYHGGCQADCVFFWKEAWLKLAERPAVELPVLHPAVTEADVIARALAPEQDNPADPIYVCQTTALYEATTLLPWWDVRQYVKDVTSGNHTLWNMVQILSRAIYRHFVNLGPGYRAKIGFYNWLMRLKGGEPYPIVNPRIEPGKPTPTGVLNLQVGELVEVRSPDEIDSTITPDGMNRGMRYDQEMQKYSGKQYRVQMRVDRLINEKTGRMTKIKNPCIQLEHVYCRAECTDRRLGCPRASNTYWREIWLKRVEPAPESAIATK